MRAVATVKRSQPFSALSAAERAAALVDPGTLAALQIEPASRGALWAGGGMIDGRPVLLALTEGRDRGGTIGVEETRVFTAVSAAAEQRRIPIVTVWDTGGVRIHEGPAALGAASAVGIALARLALLGVPVASVVTAPRGCFGAPSVIAATAHYAVATAPAHWGLTGPTLLEGDGKPVSERAGRAATAARHRHRAGQVDALVADSSRAIRGALRRFLAAPAQPVGPLQVLNDCVAETAALQRRLHSDTPRRSARDPQVDRQRDFFKYSFRGHWQPTGPEVRQGHVHAAMGLLSDKPALGIIVGPQRPHEGIGIEDAHAVARMVRHVAGARGAARAPIVIFLFCRGHANALRQERAGLPWALAACLRSLVVARLLGHPLLCVLGGGAYGAAYLALAAPSHRILAMRGTSIAPMAPRVLAAFQRLRGMRAGVEAPPDLAQLIPDIRIVESVVRLPRVLRDEITAAIDEVQPEITRRSRLYVARRA